MVIYYYFFGKGHGIFFLNNITLIKNCHTTKIKDNSAVNVCYPD
jgi:hypothetical protein